MTTPYNYNASSYGTGTYQNYASAPSLAPSPAVSLGAMGAMIGAVGATAACLPQVRSDQMTNQQAMMTIAKEAAGTGLATAAGGMLMRSVGMGGITGLVGMFAVATGVKYFWNRTMDGGAAEAQEEAKPEKKPRAKKTAKK